MDVSVKNIRKEFDRYPALNDVSLDIRSGELIALLGPSGSGKTTLLMAIAGFLRGDRMGAFWSVRSKISDYGLADALPPAAQAVGNWFAQWLSPYQANPFGLNPLRDLIKREVDFDLLAQQRYLKVFVAATNVRTGRGEIFSGARVSADAVMASACLPAMFQAVQIEGEYYWDGGYSGNPAIYPLIYETRSADVILVQINPVEAPYVPGVGAADIMERVNEITFNAPLLAEIRAIEFVSRLLAEGKLDRTRYKDVLLHRVDGGTALAQCGATSKARADPPFLRRLFTLGRGAGQDWLAEHFNDIGVCSSVEKVPHTRA